MRKQSQILILTTTTGLMVTSFFNGCTSDKLVPNQVALESISNPGSLNAQFCTKAPVPAQRSVKYIFVLDHSASNKPGFSTLNPTDVSDTDATGARRYGPLVSFLNGLVQTPNSQTAFALIDFNDTAAQVTSAGTLSTTAVGFDTNESDFANNIVIPDWIGSGSNTSPSPYDSGFTNYVSALNLVEQLISQDAQAASVANPGNAPVASSYQIVFVSDGTPLIATPTGPNPTYTQTFTTDIKPLIDQILTIKNNPALSAYISNITVNTAYYANGTSIVAAETLLQQMASEGNGQYVQFTTGQNILYQQFSPPSLSLKNHLVDVFIQNENGLYWDDGSFLTDSDGFGLPDMIKLQKGANITAKDSDGNGVSDIVEFRTKGNVCNNSSCSQAGRDPYAICAGFSPTTDSNNNVTFSASSNDGLNDCEKFVLNANKSTFNTNGNFIPDHYAFINGLPILAGTKNVAFTDPFGDGINNYTKLKQGLPIQVSIKQLQNPLIRQTSLTRMPSSNPAVDCYQLQVGQIQRAGFTDKIKVILVQNPIAGNKPFMQFAERSFGSNSSVVNFGPGDFQ